jgi:DNA-binding response OmpR family regulator
MKQDELMSDRHTVLVIDDNQEILDFIVEDLKELYTIITASHGKKALSLLESHFVHLIVSDIMMPKMDGYEFCGIVKSNIEHSHIPIILLTAKNSIQSKVQGLELGADVYIEKPFSPEYLRAQIHSLLNNRNKIQKYYASSPLANINIMGYTNADKAFLEKLNETINIHMENLDFGVEDLAEKMNMSRATLYRKIKIISDLTPNELINIARLKRAAEFLIQGELRIYEISDRVGFGSQTHFGRNFQKQFGMPPSEYVQNQKLNSRISKP